MRPMPVLVLGFSGSGKSTSIRNLDPEKTFLINCGDKMLPFKKSSQLYTEFNKDKNPNGNMITTESYPEILKFIKGISEQKKEINNIVIDDSQSLIINEFMSQHKTKSKRDEVFALYNNIAYNFYTLLKIPRTLRENLLIFYLHHAEYTENGIIQPKTMGKLLNEKIDISSNFTVVLYAIREGSNNYFITQNDGTNTAKTPEGMFSNVKIDNCLQFVRESIIAYYEGENHV